MIFQLASLIVPLVSSSPVAPDAASADRTAKTPKIASVAVRVPRKESRSKGNAILQLSLDSKPNFRAMVLHKGEKKLLAKDDGVYPDLKAGDGVFAVFDNVKEAPTRTSRGSFSNGEGEVSQIKWKVKFKIVACPPDCSSVLGSSCWICVEVTEVEVGN